MARRSYDRLYILLQGIDMFCKAGFEVAGLIFVNQRTLGVFVNQADQAGELFFSLFFIGQCTEIPDGITHRFGKITIMLSFGLGLPDSFE